MGMNRGRSTGEEGGWEEGTEGIEERARAQMRAHFVNSRSGDAHPEKASLT